MAITEYGPFYLESAHVREEALAAIGKNKKLHWRQLELPVSVSRFMDLPVIVDEDVPNDEIHLYDSKGKLHRIVNIGID